MIDRGPRYKVCTTNNTSQLLTARRWCTHDERRSLRAPLTGTGRIGCARASGRRTARESALDPYRSCCSARSTASRAGRGSSWSAQVTSAMRLVNDRDHVGDGCPCHSPTRDAIDARSSRVDGEHPRAHTHLLADAVRSMVVGAVTTARARGTLDEKSASIARAEQKSFCWTRYSWTSGTNTEVGTALI